MWTPPKTLVACNVVRKVTPCVVAFTPPNFWKIYAFFFSLTEVVEPEATDEAQSPRGGEKQTRSQILCELLRVKNEMVENSKILSKPEV